MRSWHFLIDKRAAEVSKGFLSSWLVSLPQRQTVTVTAIPEKKKKTKGGRADLFWKDIDFWLTTNHSFFFLRGLAFTDASYLDGWGSVNGGVISGPLLASKHSRMETDNFSSAAAVKHACWLDGFRLTSARQARARPTQRKEFTEVRLNRIISFSNEMCGIYCITVHVTGTYWHTHFTENSWWKIIIIIILEVVNKCKIKYIYILDWHWYGVNEESH